MTHFYASQTYIDASHQLDAACGWLQSIGIDYSKTRVGKYKRIFADLAKCQRAGKLEQFLEMHAFSDWVNAAHETAELVRIYEGLKGGKGSKLVSRLRDALRGHELYVLDTDDRSGRDFTFELSMAAKLERHGHVVDFGHDADVQATVDGVPLFIECKRLKSKKKIQKRIKEGLKQLHRRYGKSEAPTEARGILALSIGKTVNSALGLLEADSDEALGTKAFLHNAAFIDQFRSYWQTKVDPRTLGVVVVFDTPGMLSSEKKLVTVHEVTMNHCVPAGTKDYRYLQKIAHEVFAKRA